MAYKEGSSFHYIDKTYNCVCYEGEQNWESYDVDSPSAASGLRQEEHLIYKLVNQYSSPSVILNLALRNDNKIYGLYYNTTISGKAFIVDSVNIDYKHNKQELRLIEKK